MALQFWGIWWIWHACHPEAKPFESTPASQQHRLKCVWKQSRWLCKYTGSPAVMLWLWKEAKKKIKWWDEYEETAVCLLLLKLTVYTNDAWRDKGQLFPLCINRHWFFIIRFAVHKLFSENEVWLYWSILFCSVPLELCSFSVDFYAYRSE